jgi:LmbE family N-acetylglucosaminyl deacetylase
LKILCLATHADDETLGCGGTLLRHRAEGDEIAWLIATNPTRDHFGSDFLARRTRQIENVARAYKFVETSFLGLPATGVAAVPDGHVVAALAAELDRLVPDVLYLNHGGDVHSDHRAIFSAAMASTKPFRRGRSIKRIFAYETISETEQSFGHSSEFRPNSFVDISAHIDEKISILEMYEGETQPFPMPREASAVRAQARVRGATFGVPFAEAFMLIRDFR